MLIIRAKQLAALAAARRNGILKTMVHHIRTAAPEHADDTDLEQQVVAAVKRGNGLGLVDGWDLCRFALLQVVLGRGFENEEEWAQRILADESLSPTGKMDALEVVYLNYLRPPEGEP